MDLKRQMPPGDQLGTAMKTNRKANAGGFGASGADLARGYVAVPQPDRFEDRTYRQEDAGGFITRLGIPVER